MSGWIPTKERLPEEDMEYVIFTIYTPAWHDITEELDEEDRDFDEDVEVVCGTFNVYGEKRVWTWYDEYGQSVIRNEHSKSYTSRESFITAWMPLPEPYQSEIPTGTEGSEE